MGKTWASKMAQGNIKIKKVPEPKKSNNGVAKKGSRTIAPRKQQLQKNAKLIKVCSLSHIISYPADVARNTLAVSLL